MFQYNFAHFLKLSKDMTKFAVQRSSDWRIAQAQDSVYNSAPLQNRDSTHVLA